MSTESYKELKEKASHGDYLLPFAKYRTRIPINFTSYPMHWHDEIEVIIVKEGKYAVNIDLKQYEVEAGSIMIFRPGVLHNFKQIEDCNMTSFTMLFHPRLLESYVPDSCSVNYITPFLKGKYRYNPIIKPGDRGYDKVKDVIERMMITYDEKREFYEFLIKSEIFELFYYLYSYVFKLDDSVYASKVDVSQNIKLIIEFIHENFSKPITVVELADILKFSEAHFMRYFKKHVGVTCIEYINDYRINRAANLLAGTGKSVSDISEQVGIYNVSYFNRLFKKAYGISPVEYRKMVSKKIVS